MAGEEVTEGPLDPIAYAASDTPGIGGARLAAIDGNAGIEIITFDDPETSFAATLGGNAVIAPLSPLVPEPGSATSEQQPKKPRIYTVQDGDTIASIAAQFNISANTILWANGITERDILKIGDHLTILPTTGVLHTVRSGDTVLAIAIKYDADLQATIAYNNLGEDAKLAIGQKIIVPDGYAHATVPTSVPSIVSEDVKLATESPPDSAPSTGSGFAWPTASRHISQYFRWGHTGIDIDDRSRPPIYAAETGTIEFTGWLGGYGRLVVVNHGDGLSTYYAHVDKVYVTKGQKVSKGDAIAQIGSTGRSTGPHVHFEVRKNGLPINPLSMY